MKKILPLFFIIMIVLSGVSVVGLPLESIPSSSSEPQPELKVRIRGGLGVNLVIRNTGDADATDVRCFIFIGGGLIPPGPNSKMSKLGTIAPGKAKRVHFGINGFESVS